MKYILAVSGGPDSMAMLHMYRKKTQAVCIVNYQKRIDSHVDVQKATTFCDLYNIKYYIHNVSQKTYEDNITANFQNLARAIRYDFFQNICNIEKNNKLMIAHNLNDHLETAYMQFIRGSKSLYYGIKEKSYYKNLKISRPVLNFQKSTLTRYCKKHNVDFAIDITNEQDIYERNRVRKIISGWTAEQVHEYLKKISKYNHQHAKQYKQVEKQKKLWLGTKYSTDYLLHLPNDIQYYLIYEFLKMNNEKNNNHFKIENIMEWIKKPYQNTTFRLEGNKKLVINDGCLQILN